MNNKKILFTVAILLLYLFLDCLPVLGIGSQYFLKLYLGLAPHRLSVLALGLSPYITANIITFLIMVSLPSLKTFRPENTFSSAQVKKILFGITLSLALIQSFLISLRMYRILPVSLPYIFFVGLTTLTITSGVFLLLFLGRLIAKYGVGHGVSILIVFPFILWLLHSLMTLLSMDKVGTFLISGAVIFLFAWITIAMLKKTQKFQLESKVSSTNPISLNIPISIGILPAFFTYVILKFPGSMAAFLEHYSFFGSIDAFRRHHPPFDWLVTGVLFFFFTYFVVAITFNPRSMAKKIQNQGLTLAGTKEFDWRTLNRAMNKSPFYLWAGFLLVLDLLLYFISHAIKSDALVLSPADFILIVGISWSVWGSLIPIEFTRTHLINSF